MKNINTKTSSLLIAGALMLATVVPAFAAPAVTPAPAKAPAVTLKSNKVSSLKKKTPVAMKKSTNKVASIKKAK
ncbi:MAG: hypothetical protein P4L53_17455 [Candidatus Obscuribacterales bacterium]|nr:hypothetical protein [Candidatus Obscuribacterales bacterium]